ncbi:MAG: ATPase [Cetobacterium sp.]|uniref:VirB4 family type IV secretion/conjugal transfer ATPase n=1 Tax=Cetobacterium sp. TaxID=2071632 RepID=UPI003F2ABF11
MIREYRKLKDKLSYYVPWVLLLDEGVVLNKNGTLQKIFRFRGHDLDNATEEELNYVITKINNVIKRLDSGWSIFSEARRKQSDRYIKNDSDILGLKIIDTERYKHFKSGNHFESEYYLTFVYLTPLDNRKKLGDIFVKKRESTKKDLDEVVERFKKEFGEIYELLKEIFLEIYPLNDEEIYTYLHSCVSQYEIEEVKIPTVPSYMGNYLCDTPMIGGLKPQLGEKHMRTISIIDFPQYTEAGFFDRLNHLNIEYRWVTRFLALGKQEALSILKGVWNTTFQGRLSFFQRVLSEFTNGETHLNENRDALEKAEGIDEQMNLVRGDYLSQGYYTCTIIVLDSDFEEADRKAELICKTINDMGFTAIIEGVNSVEAYLGSNPGDIYHNLRKPILNSITLSHLIPLNSVWAGDIRNRHLDMPPLIYTETEGSTPFRFNLHIGDVGHTCIVGPTGTGKSVLLGTIASHFFKYPNSKVYIFDKDGSSRVLSYSMGGHFYDLGEDNLSFQPLGDVEDELELMWANEWIIEIFFQEGVELTPSQKEKIWEALKLLGTTPREFRTMTAFSNYLSDTKLKEALSNYMITGSLGRYFDSDKESINYDRWQVFEMGKIFNNKQALVPLLNYLFHKIEKKLDGSPSLIVLDECWMFFDNEIFSNKIREWLKVLRKKNTSVVFATQELGDILNSKLFTTILDACKTKIFLPNVNAGAENYVPIYEKFGLNKREIEIIANSTPKKEYYLKSEIGARKFSLALKDKSLKLIASSSQESQNLALEIYRRCKSGDSFTKEFLNLKDGEV